jgi:hypothetical protein
MYLVIHLRVVVDLVQWAQILLLTKAVLVVTGQQHLRL